MNNNRGNNRRRGRGNNRQQGGQQTNRIDSRARGNAPQLLEKYKKLAHDAHLNGDRVTEEYYLQFADHYFRVIADQKQRQDDARQPRRDDRSPDYSDDYGDDYGDYEAVPERAQQSSQERPPRQERSSQDRSGQDRSDRQERPERQERFDRQDRPERQERQERPERAPRVVDASAEEPVETAQTDDEGENEGGRSVYEPAENPFVRDIRGPSRGLKQRKPRRDRRENDAVEVDGNVAEPDASEGPSPLEAALPPAIATKPARKSAAAAREQAAEEGTADETKAEEKPRRRRTRKAPPADEAGDSTLEAVNS
ncbi:DUF4167 domain-containing protein [Novosphingobium sp. BL-8H]|uniref:DUF4167 domain-containing protein n=1 Tax=Novosphingobium sp. BL-8H TaxID=3127640 RepID=UPI0037569B98